MSLPQIVGSSRAHCEIVHKIRRIAGCDAEVLISGPTGAGKEVYARLIHASSPRAKGPFVAVNCGALPGDLFENEMFGHRASAYTGANSDSEGLASAAESGTLFLDEVDSLQLPAQIKLLRFVQFREYRRLGETRLRRWNGRLVAACNCDLHAAVEAGTFREDLLYRLRVVPIDVPALKFRQEDIMVFFDAFTEFYAEGYSLPPIALTRAARQAAVHYDWPGNVREVENCVKYLTCLQLGRDVETSDLPFSVGDTPETECVPQDLLGLPLKQAKKELVRRFEKEYLERALKTNNGNISHAARASGKHRRAFFELLRQYGLSSLARFRTVDLVAAEPLMLSKPDERQPDQRRKTVWSEASATNPNRTRSHAAG